MASTSEEERKARLRETKKRYARANREKRNAYNLQWQKDNPEKMRAYRRKWHAANPGKQREMNRTWSAKNRDKRKVSADRYIRAHPIVVLVRGARTRSRHENVPFDLSPEDLVMPQVCPVLGIPLTHLGGKLSDDKPSLDRVVPSLGYVRGNVVIISWRANRLKSDASLDDLLLLTEYIRNHNEHPPRRDK